MTAENDAPSPRRGHTTDDPEAWARYAAENGLGRDALAMALVENDPDPCDPIEYDAAAYYRAFADALLAAGYRVIPPGEKNEENS